jgi:hypothetical protein
MRKIVGLIVVCLTLALATSTLSNISAQQANPQPIGYGQTVTGDLAPDRTETLYIFTAQAGDSITITMDLDTGSLDPLLILVDQSQQTVLAVDNDSGGNHNARLRFVIPAAGTYVIRATGVQGIGDIAGSYKLTLSLGNPTPTPSSAANAPLLAAFDPENEMRGTLDDAVRVHLYTLRAKKGDPIAASLQIPDGADMLPAGLYLYNTDFHEVGRAELGSPLNVQAPADGLYFLMVARAAATGSGTYILKRDAGTTQSTQSISPGKTIHGTITADAAVKTYSLQGSTGQTISVRERRLSGDLATYVYVVSIDDGKTLAQGTDQNGIAELSVTLPTAGTYAVVATRDGQQTGTTTGNFALTVSIAGQTTPLPPAFQNYKPLDYGATLSGNIDDTTYAFPYVFNAEAGDTVQAVMTADGSDLDSYLILQNANGDTLAEDDNSAGKPNARLQATISQAGPYALIATRVDLAKGTTSGKFSLTFDTILAPDVVSANYGTLLVAGQAQASPADSPIATLYRFEAQANTAASIDFVPVGGFESMTILADGDFNQIATANGSIRTTSLPHAGTYYVLIVRAGGANQPPAGSYMLTLQGSVNVTPTAEPGTLVYGQAVTGTINNDVYQMRYKFQAKKGATLVVTMDAAPGSTLDPLVGVVDAKNSLLGVNDDAAKGLKNASLTVTIPEDGIYSVVATRAQEALGKTSGDFILKVDAQQNTTPDIVPIHYGGTVSATIDPEHYLYYYSFQGKQGDVITIQMSRVPGNTLDSVLYLYDYTSGQPALIASNNDIAPDNQDAAIIKFKLPRTGPYLIAASRAGNAQGQSTGSYILTLNQDG